MFDSQYLLMIDMDEEIVPRTNLALTEMVSVLANISGNRIGAYYFRNVFFYLS